MRSREEMLHDAKTLYDFHADCGPSFAQADLILAAGSHDLRVPRYAAKLFLDGAAPLLVCSGGLGKVTEGLWQETEGELFARECEALGVPAERIIVEAQGTNTGENFTRSRALLEARGIFPKTGILVCKPYMSKRCLATGRRQWAQVDWRVSAPPISFEDYANEDCPLEQEIQLMVGDLQRLRVYAEQGFQAPTPVPEEIWQCYERLVKDGFDRYVIR